MEYDMHARAHVGSPFASPFAMQYASPQQQAEHQHQQHQFRVQQPQQHASQFMFPFLPGQTGLQHSIQNQNGNNDGSLAVQQPYASWGTGALLNLTTTRRTKPQIMTMPSTASAPIKKLQSPTQEVESVPRNEGVPVSSQLGAPDQPAEEPWTRSRPHNSETLSYEATIAEMAGQQSHAHGEMQMMNLGQLRGLEQDRQASSNRSFQRDSESRRPSQLSDSTYATTRLTTPDMMQAADPEWGSADRSGSLHRTNMSPIESPATAALRPGSRSRASPVSHNNVRAAPYTLESNRRLRWSTGMTVPSQIPPRFPPYQQNNRYSSYFGYSPLNPHNGLTSVSNEQGITTFAAPGQNLAYSQRLSMAPHFMMHPQMYAEQHHHLAAQPMYPLLPSDHMHGYTGNYADMSDPPDLFASLHEKPCEPPEEDMNPSDPDMIPHEQELRFAGDLYTPRWVRGHGNKREGWCGLCKPGRWLVLKNSAYWYDKSFTHGVCAQTGAAFAAPETTRRVEGNVDAWEGLCGHCGEWLSLVSNKKKGPTTWFRHVSKCHVLHKPKDIPKRRRGTNRRSSLMLSGSELNEDVNGEVQPSENHMMDLDPLKRCGDDHDHHHDHSHGHHEIEYDHQSSHAHFVFGHSVSGEKLSKPLVSPAMVSPRTVHIGGTAPLLTMDEAMAQNHTASSADAQNEESKQEEPHSVSVKAEVSHTSGDLQSIESHADSTTVHTSSNSLRPPVMADASTSKTNTPMQIVQAPPSPALTPVSTPQLSETSISTPQMDVPAQSNTPVVGLGVHMLTGIPEHESHDFDFGELSRLQELYSGHASSDNLLDHGFASHEGTNNNTSDRTDVANDKMDMSYSTNQVDALPAPSSLSDGACMSSQFDLISSYPEQHDEDLHSKNPFSDDILQLHMGMQITLGGEHGEVTELTSDNYWSSMEQ